MSDVRKEAEGAGDITSSNFPKAFVECSSDATRSPWRDDRRTTTSRVTSPSLGTHHFGKNKVTNHGLLGWVDEWVLARE